MNDFIEFTRLPDGRRAFLHEDRSRGPRRVALRLSDGTEVPFADIDLARAYVRRLEIDLSRPFRTKSGG